MVLIMSCFLKYKHVIHTHEFSSLPFYTSALLTFHVIWTFFCKHFITTFEYMWGIIPSILSFSSHCPYALINVVSSQQQFLSLLIKFPLQCSGNLIKLQTSILKNKWKKSLIFLIIISLPQILPVVVDHTNCQRHLFPLEWNKNWKILLLGQLQQTTTMMMMLYMWKINYIKSPPRLHASYISNIYTHKKVISDEEKSSLIFFACLSTYCSKCKRGSKFPVVDEKVSSLSQMLQFHSVNAQCVYFSQIIAPSDGCGRENKVGQKSLITMNEWRSLFMFSRGRRVGKAKVSTKKMINWENATFDSSQCLVCS